MPSTKQRLEVWRGLRLKTSGGLRKSDLIKNKRGKIVSKRKSSQAAEKNNLGAFLRKANEKMSKKDMLHKKGSSAPPEEKEKQPAAAAPKKKAAAPKKKAAAAAKKKKQKAKPKINPITRQPYAKKSGSGYVEKGAVHVDNIRTSRRKRKKVQRHNIASF